MNSPKKKTWWWQHPVRWLPAAARRRFLTVTGEWWSKEEHELEGWKVEESDERVCESRERKKVMGEGMSM